MDFIALTNCYGNIITVCHLCLTFDASMIQTENSGPPYKMLQLPNCPRTVLWGLFVHEVGENIQFYVNSLL
jgi:hypothetical protein